MQETEKTKEQLNEEFKNLEREYNRLKEEFHNAKIELDNEKWGLEKTNAAIKVLYKELEKKNRELQALDKMKSDFVNVVSHELRTPLTTIRESISQVLDGILGQTTEQQREFLSICLEDADRLKRIIDNLLDMSKIEAGRIKLKRKKVDIVDLAKGVVLSFSAKAKAKNLELREDYPKEKVVIYIDRDAIIQVFTNLIGNAIKFTEKGYIGVSVADFVDHVDCSVSDTGRGIAEDNLPKMFNKFQQFAASDVQREKGTGLGLSISKGIIDLHGGDIWTESSLNKGTKFSFRLPKYTEKDLFKGQLAKGIKEAIQHKNPLSILVFILKRLGDIESNKIDKDLDSIMHSVEGLLRHNLRHNADGVIKYVNAISAVLPETTKKDSIEVAERLKGTIIERLSKDTAEANIEVSYIIVSYPEDGETQKEIYDKIVKVVEI